MLERIFGGHSENLNRALSRTAQRHGLVTTNLANANVPGYKRQDVEVGIALEGESRGIDRLRERQGVQTNTGSTRADGSSVDLETEVLAVAESQLRYQALTEMTNRYFQGLRRAIREGR